MPRSIADRLIREGGATPGFLGYNGFPRSICVSINDEAVHGIPGHRKINEGDLVTIEAPNASWRARVVRIS